MVQIDLVRLVPAYAGIGGFATLTCGIFVTFLIEEEFLCEAQIRPEKSDVRFSVFCLLYSVFSILCLLTTTGVLACGQSTVIYFHSFEGGLLCIRN